MEVTGKGGIIGVGAGPWLIPGGGAEKALPSADASNLTTLEVAASSGAAG